MTPGPDGVIMPGVCIPLVPGQMGRYDSFMADDAVLASGTRIHPQWLPVAVEVSHKYYAMIYRSIKEYSIRLESTHLSRSDDIFNYT